MPPPSHRPQYTSSQLTTYFAHISLPHPPSPPLSNPLDFLTRLQQHQLSTVPFENLSLHYSPHHRICLDAESLYRKIVNHARGGYCMENNACFGTVLRSLGFEVCSVGGRVNALGVAGRVGEEWVPWSHMVNIVTLSDGRKYMLDVGFGGNGPVRPLLLDAEASHTQGIGAAEMRLVRRNIEPNTDVGQRLWVYEYRNDTQSEWLAIYCFTELEFLPQDYEMMSFWTSQSRQSWFTYRIVVVRMVMEEGVLVGRLVLNGEDLKRSIRGETEHLKTCRTEEERLAALDKYFGIRFSDLEKAGIKGMVTELRE